MPSVRQDYEGLLQDKTEEEILLLAFEESRRHYEEVELPRVSQVQSKAGPSTEQDPIASGSGVRKESSMHPENCEEKVTFHFRGLNEDGFDLDAGSTWIYPVNYKLREYQFNIVQNALYKNTLVSLDTGLGKTFIAAVVMYNFYRWYPQGLVLFLAPTRPLVAQQIDACYKITGIPKSDTVEMTGSVPPKLREKYWKKCRVFFLTPQSLMSDLSRSTCPVEKVRCIVIDEAHKATGNYAYCQAIQAILPFNEHFRVLALSATPGSDMDAMQQVIKNLRIEHVEVRDETSPDVQGFTHQRLVDIVVVKLGGFHKEVEGRFINIIQGYMSQIQKLKLLYNNVKHVSKYQLLMARTKFRQSPPPNMSKNAISHLESDFAVCMSLCHGLELITQQGLRNFYQYLKGILEDADGSHAFIRGRLAGDNELASLMDDIEEQLGGTSIKEPDPNKSLSRIITQVTETPRVFTHPKMEKLRDVVVAHFQSFQQREEETRVMVFCQYRGTVSEICHVLSREKLVKAMSFVGQSSNKASKGFSQKVQLQVMEKFRRGGYNTLVSTCVGEEGLDIGEVDLIVCYDAHASPIRLVQRMGRTGRKRQGRIVMLLTEGKERQKYTQSLNKKKNMANALLNSKQFLQFTASPRMIPEGIEPVCYKMFMTMPKVSHDRDLKKMLSNKSAGKRGARNIKEHILNTAEEEEISEDLFPEQENLHSLDPDELQNAFSMPLPKIDLARDLDWVMNDNETIHVSRSKASEDLVALLQLAGKKRCDLPISQTASMASQVCRTDLWPGKKRKRSREVSSKGRKRTKKNADVEKGNQNRLTSLWSAITEAKNSEASETRASKSDYDLMPPPLPPLARPVKSAHAKNTLKEKQDKEHSVALSGADDIVMPGIDSVDDICLSPDILVVNENSSVTADKIGGIFNCEEEEEEEEETFKESLDTDKPSQQDLVASLNKDWNLINSFQSDFKNLLSDICKDSCSFCNVGHCHDLSLILASDYSVKSQRILREVSADLPDEDQIGDLVNPAYWKNLVSKSPRSPSEEKDGFDCLLKSEDFECQDFEEEIDFNDSCSKRISPWNITPSSVPDYKIAPKKQLLYENVSRFMEGGDPYVRKFSKTSSVASCDVTLSEAKHDFTSEEDLVLQREHSKQELSVNEKTANDHIFTHPTGFNLKKKTNKNKNNLKESHWDSTYEFKIPDESNRNVIGTFCDGAEERDTGFDLGLSQLLSLSPGISKQENQETSSSGYRKTEYSGVSVSSGLEKRFQQQLLETESKRQVEQDFCNFDMLSDFWNEGKSDKKSDDMERKGVSGVPNICEQVSQNPGDVTQYVDDAVMKWFTLGNDEFDHPFPEEQPSPTNSCVPEAAKAPSPVLCSQKKKKSVKLKRLFLGGEDEPQESERSKSLPVEREVSANPLSPGVSFCSKYNEREDSDLRHLLSGVDFEEQMDQLANCVEGAPDAPLSPIIGSQPAKSFLSKPSPSDVLLRSSSSPSLLAAKFSLPGQRSASTPKVDKRFIKKQLFTGLRFLKKETLKAPAVRCDGENSFSFRDTSHKESFNSDSDSDFESKATRQIGVKVAPTQRGKIEKNNQVNKVAQVFIQDEAEESREDRRDSSDGENTSGLDDLDNSFVDDEEQSQMHHDSVDIQAQYLQSVRSPVKRHGQFKMKEVKNVRMDVYSQVPPEEELNESYEEDSFCVNTSSEVSESEAEPDTLDVIEAALKHKKRKKHETPKSSKRKKRKRIRVLSSSSDEGTSPKQIKELRDDGSVILVSSQDEQDIHEDVVPLTSSSSKPNRFAHQELGAKASVACNVGGGTSSKSKCSLKIDCDVEKAGHLKLSRTTTSDDVVNVAKNHDSSIDAEKLNKSIKFSSPPVEVVDLCDDIEWGDDFDELKVYENWNVSPAENLCAVSSESWQKSLNDSPSKKINGLLHSQGRGQAKRKLKCSGDKPDKMTKLTDYFSHGIKQATSSVKNHLNTEEKVNLGNQPSSLSTNGLKLFRTDKTKSVFGGGRYPPVCVIENSSEMGKKDLARSKPREGLLESSSSSCSGRSVGNKVFPLAVSVEAQDYKGEGGKLVVFVSSCHVNSFPEIITALKSRHRITVHVLSIKTAQFVISSQVGVQRIPFDEFCRLSNWSSILEAAEQMKSLFRQPYFVVELKGLEAGGKALWPPPSLDLSSKVQERGVNILYSESKAITADLLASLCYRENSCNRTIQLPKEEGWQLVIQFLELLPCINVALALELCFKYKTIAAFMKSCKTVASIQETLGVNREAARELYFLLHDVAI